MRGNIAVSKWGAALVLLLLVSVVAAQPPRPGPNDTGTTRDKKVQERVAYWMDVLKKARSVKEVDTVRNGLLRDIDAARAENYAQSYARALAQQGRELLQGGIGQGDPLRPLKEVNVALAIAKTSQPAAHPALELMVGHPNAAVRYWGWKGYKGVRDRVLGTDRQAKAMIKSLEKAAGETAPAGLGAVFEALYFPLGRPTAVPEGAYAQLQDGTYALLEKIWLDLCRRILAGDTDLAYTCTKAAGLARQLDQTLSEKQKPLRQMLINLTWCAGQSYDRFYLAAKQADDRAKEAEKELFNLRPDRPTEEEREEEAAPGRPPGAGPAGAPGLVLPGEEPMPEPGERRRPNEGPAEPKAEPPTTGPALDLQAKREQAEEEARIHRQNASAMALLLRDCERELEAMHGTKFGSIPEALNKRKMAGVAVREAILKWAERFKNDGVKTPRASDFEPTTKPATSAAPAG